MFGCNELLIVGNVCRRWSSRSNRKVIDASFFVVEYVVERCLKW